LESKIENILTFKGEDILNEPFDFFKNRKLKKFFFYIVFIS